MSPQPERQEILIECVSIGATLSIAAINAATGLEVRFQVPAQTRMEEIRRLASAKLRYVAEKKGKSLTE
ncbi:MAG: hypothetical protein ABTQ34_08700 [Bdellovibrionales bacterium]